MSDLILSTPKMPSRIEIESQWLKTRDNFIDLAKNIEVKSQDDYERAEILLKKITQHSNKAEKLRKDFSKPFNTFVKKVKKLADDARKPIEEVKGKLKKVMSDYLTAEEERQRQEIAEQVAEQVEDNPFAEFTSDIAPVVETPTKLMSSQRSYWRFEIEDSTKVPREFCCPDEKKIREYVQREKEAGNIPGVRIWEEKTVQSR